MILPFNLYCNDATIELESIADKIHNEPSDLPLRESELKKSNTKDIETNIPSGSTGSSDIYDSKTSSERFNLDSLKEVDSTSSEISEEELLIKKIMEKQKNLKRTFVPMAQKKGKLNDSSEVLRDDKQILTYNVSVNDIVTTEVCYSSPVRILLGPSIGYTLFSATADDPISFGALVMEDKRSALVALKQPLTGSKVIRTRLRLVRDTDFKSYIVDITGVNCADRSKFDFPAEIVLENKATIKSNNDNIMSAEDLIVETTLGYARKNKTNLIEVYSGVMTASSDWSSLGVSIKLGDSKRKNMNIEFIVFDALQNSIIASSAKFLEKSSEKATKLNNHPTLRINLKINVSKKYVIERNYVYIAMLDHDKYYYQYARVDLKNLYKRLKQQGYDLN